MREIVVPQALAGSRLDHAVSVLCGFSLRGARRLISDLSVSLNGSCAKSAYKVRAGDRLALREADTFANRARFIARKGAYCFFYKPAGLHSVALAGRPNASLEQFVPELCQANGIEIKPQLLQRLDYGTSGLICAALGNEAQAAYRAWQQASLCKKYYLALLSGNLQETVQARNALAGSGKKVACRQETGPKLNWTLFEPLWRGTIGQYGQVTLARCLINSGLRHQIRAHAAALGHPLAGDELYGGKPGNYILSHYRLEFPGCQIAWLDPGLKNWLPHLPADFQE